MTSSRPPPPPPLSHMLETCLYVHSMSRSTKFYKEIMGLTPDFETERITPFPLSQNTTLILFQLGLTSEDSHPNSSDRPTDVIPGHGPEEEILTVLLNRANGGSRLTAPKLKQHFCFAVQTPADVERWEEHLRGNGVEVLGSMMWERGGRSVYFADPDGHVGEVGSRGIWNHFAIEK